MAFWYSCIFIIIPVAALWPTQPLIEWVREALSPGVKSLGREADNLHSYSVEVKNGGAIPPFFICLHYIVPN
jgi:hypothetical protein